MRQCIRMLLFLLCAQPFTAGAQLLEPLPLPPLREVLQPPLREAIGVTAPASTLMQPLATEARQLLMRHPAYLEGDQRGLPIMRAVIIALSPDPDALARALARGYVIQ